MASSEIPDPVVVPEARERPEVVVDVGAAEPIGAAEPVGGAGVPGAVSASAPPGSPDLAIPVPHMLQNRASCLFCAPQA